MQNKPEETLAMLYADAKKNITLAIRNEMQNSQLPLFMVEAILTGFLCEMRNEAYMELAADVAAYKRESNLEVHTAQVKKEGVQEGGEM